MIRLRTHQRICATPAVQRLHQAGCAIVWHIARQVPVEVHAPSVWPDFMHNPKHEATTARLVHNGHAAGAIKLP